LSGRLLDSQRHALATIYRLKLLGVGGNANAVAHRVAFLQTLQLANAARCVLDPTRSAKFIMACCCLSPPSGIGIST
jgi:hypothetical protein